MLTNKENTEKRKKALKNANISDRRLRSFDINELVQVRKEFKKKAKK